MKLTELNPRWYTSQESHGHKIGMTFDCPHCQSRRLSVPFHHTGMDAIFAEEPDCHGSESIWLIEGDHNATTFENVTITPSVDASKFGHWHGFIKNGEISTV